MSFGEFPAFNPELDSILNLTLDSFNNEHDVRLTLDSFNDECDICFQNPCICLNLLCEDCIQPEGNCPVHNDQPTTVI